MGRKLLCPVEQMWSEVRSVTIRMLQGCVNLRPGNMCESVFQHRDGRWRPAQVLCTGQLTGHLSVLRRDPHPPFLTASASALTTFLAKTRLKNVRLMVLFLPMQGENHQ